MVTFLTYAMTTAAVLTLASYGLLFPALLFAGLIVGITLFA